MGKSYKTRKVCILTTLHSPFDPRIFQKEAKTLAKAGYDVTVIAQHDKREFVDRVKIIPLPKPRNRFTRILSLSWRAFWLALKQRADIYHFHDPELLPWGWFLKWFTHKPVVYDVHEYYRESVLQKEWLPVILRRPAAYLVDWMEKQLSRRLAGVVVVNNHMGCKFEKYADSVIVLPNYPLKALFEHIPRSRELEKRYKDYRILIYVGGLAPSRGIPRSINIMRRLRQEIPNIKLLMIVRCANEQCRQQQLSLVKETGLANTVEILGPFRHEEVRKYLALADIGLFLLQPESERYNWGEPIKYFEYSAAGLPVIISDLPSKRRLVEKNQNGILVDPLNEESIAKAIASLLNDPHRMEEMGKRGREAFLREYNWEAIEGRLIHFYEELLGENND